MYRSFDRLTNNTYETMTEYQIEFESWMENEGVTHEGNYKYLYNSNLYTLDQLEALWRVRRLVDRWSK